VGYAQDRPEADIRRARKLAQSAAFRNTSIKRFWRSDSATGSQIRTAPEANGIPALPDEAKAADMPCARRTGDNLVPFRIDAIGRG